MNNELEKLLSELKKITLTTSEREGMREHLSAYADQHSVSPGVMSPIQLVPSPYRFLRTTFAKVLAAFIIVLLSGGGTVFAAEGALPGDVLYPVKIQLNEQIVAVTATTPEEKADWSARQAERRLEEASALAVEGRLTLENRTELETKLTEHIAKSTEETKVIEEEGKTDVALEARSNLEYRLKAQASVMGLLASTSVEESNETKKLLSSLQSNIRVVSEARVKAEIAVGTTSLPSEEKITKASKAALRAQEAVSKNKNATTSPLIVQAKARIAVAEKALKEARNEKTTKQNERAYFHADEAERAAEEASVLLKESNFVKIEKKEITNRKEEKRKEVEKKDRESKKTATSSPESIPKIATTTIPSATSTNTGVENTIPTTIPSSSTATSSTSTSGSGSAETDTMLPDTPLPVKSSIKSFGIF